MQVSHHYIYIQACFFTNGHIRRSLVPPEHLAGIWCPPSDSETCQSWLSVSGTRNWLGGSHSEMCQSWHSVSGTRNWLGGSHSETCQSWLSVSGTRNWLGGSQEKCASATNNSANTAISAEIYALELPMYVSEHKRSVYNNRGILQAERYGKILFAGK